MPRPNSDASSTAQAIEASKEHRWCLEIDEAIGWACCSGLSLDRVNAARVGKLFRNVSGTRNDGRL
jgi:hypothetical protein